MSFSVLIELDDRAVRLSEFKPASEQECRVVQAAIISGSIALTYADDKGGFVGILPHHIRRLSFQPV